MKCSQLDWCSQQLYQELALNCKGEVLAKINALAAGGDEGTRGVTAWHGQTRSPWIQRAKNSGVGWERFPSFNGVSRCRIFQVTLSCGRVAFESMRSWSSRQRRSRQRFPTVARFSSFAAWCPKIWKRTRSKSTPQRTTRRQNAPMCQACHSASEQCREKRSEPCGPSEDCHLHACGKLIRTE